VNNQQAPGEGKLFLVSRTLRISKNDPASQDSGRLLFADYLFILIVLIFVVVVGIAAYLCLHSSWERARDFILIFLPITCLLMGVAIAACFRP
jgi:hypothetical protein